MEKSIKILSNRRRDIENILNDIKADKPSIIKDVYELSDELYEYMKKFDDKLLDKFCNMIKSFIENDYIFDDLKEITNVLLKSKYMNTEFIKYFFDGLKIFNLKMIDNIIIIIIILLIIIMMDPNNIIQQPVQTSVPYP